MSVESQLLEGIKSVLNKARKELGNERLIQLGVAHDLMRQYQRRLEQTRVYLAALAEWPGSSIIRCPHCGRQECSH